MEDLGYHVLTAQNGPEALSLERAVSRSTDLVMPHISGAKLGSGYPARMPRAAAGLARAAKLRAALAGSTKLSEADAFRKRSPARPAVALSGMPLVLKLAVSGDRE
jgi:hypothetical protein